MNVIKIRKDAKDKRKIYILRRVVFVVIVFICVISLLFIIFSDKNSINIAAEVDITPKIDTYTPFLAITTPEPTKKALKILIYQTHNDEAYYKGNKKYEETDTGRTLDENFNVISVGNSLKNKLIEYGFDVVHDKSDNVSDGFNVAYDTSLKNIKDYGEFDIYIDVHRDAYYPTENNYIKHNNKEYAYIRFVVANGTKYKEKPNYKNNYEFAEKISEELNFSINGIAKEIYLKDARLNQHLSDKCLLVEIGNEKNDIAQVINSAELLASIIAKIC